MSSGITYDSRDALRRIDFYWNTDALLNTIYSTITIPAISIQLYSPIFSPWRTDTAIEVMYLTSYILRNTLKLFS